VGSVAALEGSRFGAWINDLANLCLPQIWPEHVPTGRLPRITQRDISKIALLRGIVWRSIELHYVETFPGAASLSSDRAAMLQSGSPPFLARHHPIPCFTSTSERSISSTRSLNGKMRCASARQKLSNGSNVAPTS
jgi:hypothetical protein